MFCSNCGNEQKDGAFCGQCGNKLSEGTSSGLEKHPASAENIEKEKIEAEQKEAYAEAAAGGFSGTEHHSQPTDVHAQIKNERMDRVKEKSRIYGAYFVANLKHPSKIFSANIGSNEMKYGLITLSIITVLMALASPIWMRNMSSSQWGFGTAYYDGPAFFQVFIYVLIFVAIAILISITVIFLINQWFGTAFSFKKMISIYSAHMVPIAVLTAVAALLILLQSNFIGFYLLIFSFVFLISTVPIYLMSNLLTRRSRAIDPLYAYIIYLGVMGIAFSIYVSIVFDTTIGRLIGGIPY